MPLKNMKKRERRGGEGRRVRLIFFGDLLLKLKTFMVSKYQESRITPLYNYNKYNYEELGTELSEI